MDGTLPEYRPTPGTFEPTLKYSWGSVDAADKEDSVMMTPIVIQLDDDNCDGLVNQRDIPEIVFATFSNRPRPIAPNGNQFPRHQANGTLHVVSIVDGVMVEKWTANSDGTGSSLNPGRAIAGGNIDGVPGNEIVMCTADRRARAFRGDGSILWTSEPVACHDLSLADLDQDGAVEVLTSNSILDGATGIVNSVVGSLGGRVLAYDVTGDGFLDLVGANGITKGDGSVVGSFRLSGGVDPGPGNIAFGDLDSDGKPEIIFAESGRHLLHIFQVDLASSPSIQVVRENVDINGDINPNRCGATTAGRTRGGGPPTVADTNGDGVPDVALAGGVGYTVFDGKKLMDSTVGNSDTIMWATETQDCSSANTGSSVFDFDGDGRAEVVYGDEVALHIYDGMTGESLFETCNTNGTLNELPVIADVDSDGRADIVAVSNNYTNLNCEGEKTTGLRIWGDAGGDWVRTRTIWNQHSYHVTNVDLDGEIPKIESSNHLDANLNNYRLNVQPLGEFSAPDLRVELVVACGATYKLLARVRNFGEASAPVGVPVSMYLIDSMGTRTLVPGSPMLTTRILYPGEGEDFEVTLPTTIPVDTVVEAIVDEDPSAHLWQECRLDNNRSNRVSSQCGID